MTAKARLAMMVAATQDPVLTDGEVEMLLDLARRPDIEDRSPDAVGWVPTWALGAAAAEGWRWKAGKASPRVDMQGDDSRLSRSQMFSHCMQMAARYDRQAWAAVPIVAPDRGDGLARDLGWGPVINAGTSIGDRRLAPFALPGAAARGDNTW